MQHRVLTAFLVFGLLAACAGDEPAPDGEDGPPPTASPEPEPEPEPKEPSMVGFYDVEGEAPTGGKVLKIQDGLWVGKSSGEPWTGRNLTSESRHWTVLDYIDGRLVFHALFELQAEDDYEPAVVKQTGWPAWQLDLRERIAKAAQIERDRVAETERRQELADERKEERAQQRAQGQKLSDDQMDLGISKAAFDTIKNGMSYKTVVKIIGEEGELNVDQATSVSRDKIYTWQKWSGANMIIQFQNGKVVSKAQAGL